MGGGRRHAADANLGERADDVGPGPKSAKADGGVSENRFVLQFLSNILGLEVEHSKNPETTALGAAFMAGLTTGFWSSKDDLLAIRKIDKIYTPQMTKEERIKKYSFWKNIINRSLNYDIS